jgi:putative ABC transport system ATP-binding protein
MNPDEIVRLEKVVKTYFLDHVEVPALRGVDLLVERGEFISIMGPSGSGKSTLMHLIGCLDRPTSGKVLIEGVDVSKLSDDGLAEIRRKKIGFVFQQFNLIPRLTARENVELPMWFAGLSKADRLRRANQLLERVGIAHRAEHKPAELSGGESQRVAIARALANDPEIILADEPTGNLDTKSGEEIIGLLKELSERGKTVILVTHDPVFGMRAERTISIRDGVIQ